MILFMDKNIREAILETICDAALLPAELLIAFLRAGYGASHWKLRREIENVQSWREISVPSKVRRNFQNILYRLKEDGLIKRDESGWMSTALGKERLKLLQHKSSFKKYEIEPIDSLIIVIFDIPEKHKSKRAWLRAALKVMGFKMVQKSVWSGKIKLPKKFIDDLKRMDIFDQVDIFKAVKLGSLS